MADRLVLNFPAMQQAAADIQNAINKLQSDLDQLEADAKPLVATWTGPAQEAYHARQAQWTNAANDLKQILMAIHKALVDSTEEFQQTEHANASRFG